MKRPTVVARRYGWDDWFLRVRGWGLSVMPLKGHRPLFSERLGIRPAHHALGHCWKVLRP